MDSDESTLPVNAFTFVSILDPNAPEDPAVRRLIRKQAMKNAADARIRRGNHGKQNHGQFPVFDVVESRPAPVNETRRKKQKHKNIEKEISRPSLLAILATTVTVPTGLFQTSYELMSMKYGFDALDISMLAAIHISRAARLEFLQNPTQLTQILSKKRFSYFSYLPSRYGHSTCLNDATDCLVSRVRQIMSPDSGIWAKTVLSLYVRALKSLQAAIQCAEMCLEAEVLCATAILALYEFLDPSRDAAWTRHTLGIANLIKMRGPQRFDTNFEKAIFVAQIAPIMTESIMNNDRCFLAEEIWKPVFQSLVDDSSLISNRSQMVVDLTRHLARVSGLFKDVTSLVCGKREDVNSSISELRSQILTFRDTIATWGVEYNNLYRMVIRSNPSEITMETHWVVIGIFLTCATFGARLLGAVSGLEERKSLEEQCQHFSDQVLCIAQREKTINHVIGLGLAQKVGIARATKATGSEWVEPDKGLNEEMNRDLLIEKWKFVHWCELFGRRTC